ncbi:hydrogenase nickel incorporation protein HypB [Sulfuricella sp. T08]|uniref:hydrogenase nickel incorporation protein HypB n=1 Tax=Sulfuricella sp. T08 TaxID=1632857 RepID=UPI000617A0A8|nr:hydrogenase nickel incorporation protein HypB [Sulfuricella sp. T08]GAO35011.1 hydrogenase nickel incorporation protein HypB [Sulfuricella sp. T08]
MCTTCGCGQGETKIDGEEHTHAYVHAHEHGSLLQGRPHAHTSRMVQVEQDILAKNNQYASANRSHFAEHGIFALNLVSSPGSGKTSLLTRTIERFKDKTRIAVIEGDQQTSLDADRIRATGVSAVQINTGKGCHLDAHMVGHAMEKLALADNSLLLIENVGNLVCPAAFDLGEAHKVAILSVTEGEDKPLKYPDMFAAAEVMLLNKMDLLPYLNFNVPLCIEYARRINPYIRVILTSAVSGEGMDEWREWIAAGMKQAAEQKANEVDALKRRVAKLEAELSNVRGEG